MKDNDGLKEQMRQKHQISSEDLSNTSKKTDVTTPVDESQVVPPYQKSTPLPTRNFFAPLRTDAMETESRDSVETGQGQQAPASNTGRPPPIVLTSNLNQINLQKI
jgi:hypothetical protein